MTPQQIAAEFSIVVRQNQNENHGNKTGRAIESQLRWLAQNIHISGKFKEEGYTSVQFIKDCGF